MQALEVIGEAEKVEFPVLLVPVTAYAFKAAGVVIEAVRQESDLRVAIGDKRAAGHHPNVSKFHARASPSAIIANRGTGFRRTFGVTLLACRTLGTTRAPSIGHLSTSQYEIRPASDC